MTVFGDRRSAGRPRPALLLALAVWIALVDPGWLPALDRGGPARWTAIEVAGISLRVEIADTPRRIARGLKYRDSLGPDEGMLFVFPEPAIRRFWMKDTRIDLDIGFFDSDGRLLNIAHMKAFDTDTRHQSVAPAQYALEVNRGWFAGHRLGPGASLDLSALDQARPPALP
jgi:uncharacterized membrane protein (UPF0127 family)